jgi:hypothetical protein
VAAFPVPAVQREGTELVPPQSDVHLPQAWNPLAEAGVSITNLPLDDPDGSRLQLVALNGSHPKIKSNVNRELELYAYVMHPYERENPDDGEIQAKVRLVIVCHDGTMYQGSGKYTIESLARIVRSKGPGPWHPPIKVVIEAPETTNGRNIYKLVPPAETGGRMPWQPPKGKGGKNAQGS